MIAGLGSNRHLRSGAAGILTVSVDGQGDDNDKRNYSPDQARFLVVTTGRWLASSTHGRTARAKEALCSFLSILVDFNLECDPLSELGAMPIPWKSRDVYKHFRAALRGSDESEAPIVIPFRESTFDAHVKGLT